jgi:hypothetical protein
MAAGAMSFTAQLTNKEAQHFAILPTTSASFALMLIAQSATRMATAYQTCATVKPAKLI